LAVNFLADFSIELHEFGVDLFHRLVLTAIDEVFDFFDECAVLGDVVVLSDYAVERLWGELCHNTNFGK